MGKCSFSSKPRHVTPQIDSSQKNEPCSYGSNKTKEMSPVHFSSKARFQHTFLALF